MGSAGATPTDRPEEENSGPCWSDFDQSQDAHQFVRQSNGLCGFEWEINGVIVYRCHEAASYYSHGHPYVPDADSHPLCSSCNEGRYHAVHAPQAYGVTA